MPILNFSLLPDATARVYEALVCLAKFGESVSLEARSEKLTITALNTSRTAYASFALDAKSFFISYDFSAGSSVTLTSGDRFTCLLSNKALQSVFKGRSGEGRGREALIERCEAYIQDQPDKLECRLIVKLLCRHGMTKTYRLTYESVEVMHALFDKTAASQGWSISARMLREYIEFFGPRTEQLDIVASEGKANFTSYTEKIQDGKEVLKQPLETAIAIHTEDFDDFHMQENMHITISVKDFKAIVIHAETLRTSISAHFSLPSRPLQFSYHNFGVYSEFTLITTGTAAQTPTPKFISTRSSSSRQPSAAPFQPSANQVTSGAMPPPARPMTKKSLTSNSQRQPIHQPSITESDTDPESLFMPAGNAYEDNPWDPPNFDEDNGEEMLGWDASNENSNASFHPTFRDSGSARPQREKPPHEMNPSQEGLEPTQRLSQLHGMFD